MLRTLVVLTSMAGAICRAQGAGELRLRLAEGQTVPLGENLVPNAGFEAVDGNRPRGWAWDPRNTDATFEIVEPGRRGGRAVRITNGTPSGPHIYGQLTLLGGLALTPGEQYTLSCYLKSDDPGAAWTGGGSGWWMRLYLRGTEGKWKRFTRTFVAADKDGSFPLMLNTDSPTAGLVVDDVKLEKGPAATPMLTEEDAARPSVDFDLPDPLSCANPELSVPIWVYVPHATQQATVACDIVAEDGKPLASSELKIPLAQGASPVTVAWNLGDTPNVTCELRVRVAADGATAEFAQRTRLLTMAGFRQVNAPVAPAIRALRAAVERAKGAGEQVPYPVAALQVAERFSRIVEATAQAGSLEKASRYSGDLLGICTRATEEANAIAEGGLADRPVPDPPMDQTRLNGRNFEVQGRPVSLVGPLGYGELLDEIETVRNYGFNVVGDDWNAFSALHMVTGEDTLDETAVPKLMESWDRLRALNLAISFVPTLHYFPEWALTKYPDITGGEPVDQLPDWSGLGRHKGKPVKTYGGFFPFAIESPTVHQLVERYYARLFPAIAKHPSFHLVWLMNEPTYRSSDPAYVQAYHEWLQRKHGTIDALNQAWGTTYASFEAIEPAQGATDPGRFDFLTFHNEHVAEWFAWLAAEVRKHDPSVVLSNKPMAWTILQPWEGIDFERQAEIMDVPGCDAGRSPAPGAYAFGWAEAAFLFDFYASVAPQKPQADLEYHYVHDPFVTDAYVRATYWQSYLHGLRFSAFWVWATGQLGTGEAGAGMTDTAWSQPLVGWGTASAALDLRRLAPEVAAFPPPAEAALYFSKPSLYLDDLTYTSCLRQAYEALFFCDTPVGFVTDRMIREGKLRGLKLLIVPRADFVEADVRAEIARFAEAGGHVLLIGDCLRKDQDRREHGREVAGPDVSRVEPARAEEMSREFGSLLSAAGVTRTVRALGADGANAWAVECRSVPRDNDVLCSLLNLRRDPVEVRLEVGGRPIGRWEELIEGKSGTSATLRLEPMVPLLLRIRQD
ncbi:MAG: hypothetical protein FJX75_15460 [Armatimonadetes bacterium]|nr:hypothetical protein [Armatimonadota bacterium]